MKILTMIFVFLLASQDQNAQNLVSNGSFEDYTLCPDTTDSFPIGWEVFCESPDYYHACANAVPLNIAGYQYASTGDAYVGLLTYVETAGYSRELLAYRFFSPLEIGEKYYVSFKVNLSEYYWNDGGVRGANNNLGAKFTTQSYYTLMPYHPALVNNFAHINTSDIITDSINWVTVSGSFIADSAYNYVVLGNFFDDEHTDTLHLGISGTHVAYYFIDDVCVSKDSVSCSITSGMEEKISNNLDIVITYNSPFLQIIDKKNIGKISFNIYDISGRLIKKGNVDNSNYTIDCADLSAGFYVVNLQYLHYSYIYVYKFIVH